jgi:CheY-like chemotaxis protein
MKTTDEILVVDDDTRMRDLVVKVLTREGYSVRALSPGQDVLMALAEAPADLVISDIRMPGMDGVTLTLPGQCVREGENARPEQRRMTISGRASVIAMTA